MERHNIAVPKGHSGEAVARILHDGLGVPHSTAKGLIDAGCVTINGRPARSHGQRCEGGDVVEVRFDPERRYEPHPQLRHGPGFRVVHEDPEIVVVDKTPGLLSSPAPGRRDDSLAELIAESLRARGIKKPQLFVVHRLDQHTSGLLVFARTPRAMEWLVAQFESREAGRTYTALVQGRVERDRATIQSWLVEDPKTLSVHTTALRGAGKRALTHFAVQERFPDATLVRVSLETGRKHQIRVHFAEIGHPVLGDRRYGEPSELLSRVALHAERLTFRHPRTLEKVTFEAPWPEDLAKLVQRLRRAGAGRTEDAGATDAHGGAAVHGASDEAMPRAGSPFGRGPGPVVVPRAEAERRGEMRPYERGRHERTRVEVLPQGLTLTDPMGPSAAILMERPSGRHESQVPAGGAAPAMARGSASRGPAARGPAPRGPAPRGPAPRGPATRELATRGRHDEPSLSGSIERRDRLLRERAVGNRPPQHRLAGGGERPPVRPEREDAPWKRDASSAPRPRTDADPTQRRSETTKPWKAQGPQSRAPRPEGARAGKPWQDKRRGPAEAGGAPSGARRWSGKPGGDKRWSGKPREGEPRGGDPRGGEPAWRGNPRAAKPYASKPHDMKPGNPRERSDVRGASSAGKPWSGKPGTGKPWAGKPRESSDARGAPAGGKPWSGKPAGGKPWAGKPRDAKPWAGKPRDAKPWAGGSRDRSDARGASSAAAKPWSGKPAGGKPWAGKPRDAKPYAGKPRDAKPWAGKPLDAKPWTGKPGGGKPFAGKPRDAKPWAGKTHDAKPWAGKARDAKPWASGKPRDAKPYAGKPHDMKLGKAAPSGGPAGKARDPQAGGGKHQARHAGGGGAARKPWDFPQKGATLKRERRRKIASAQAKGRGKGKKS